MVRILKTLLLRERGVFDGTGEVWRPVKKEKLTESQWRDLLKSGGVVSEDELQWFPSESYKQAQEISEMNVPRNFTTIEQFQKIRDFLRPVMVRPCYCKKSTP